MTPDQDLEDFLAGRSDLSRRYRAAGSEEPPPELDRKILAQAQAAVEEKAPNVVPLPRRNRARWMVPFAVAATVVLSLAIFREAGLKSGLAPQEVAAPASAPEAQTSADAGSAPVPQAFDAAKTAEEVAVLPPPPPPAEVTTPSPNAPAANAVQSVTPRPAPATARSLAAEGRTAPVISPEDWLRDIRVLREAGRNDEADTALQNFLKAYPDYFDRNPDVARP